jgi:hypothetical protein
VLQTFVVAYPWDLIDEGVEVVLDRLQGEIGFGGMSLWAAAPPVTQLCPGHAGHEPHVFCTHGGAFFQPRSEHYAASRCKPGVSEWAKTRNPLKTIAEACNRRKLRLRVRISAAATGRLAQRHPEMVCKNAFGAQSSQSVCLANPDVQAYLRGLAADLSANYTPAGITVTDFALGWIEAFGSDLQTATPLGETERALLFACFCESCRQKARNVGVDVEQALRNARVILQKSLDAGRPSDTSIGSVVEDNPALADFYHWRAEELSSLLRRMGDACDCELLFDRGSSGTERMAGAGPDRSIPAAVVTPVEYADGLASAVCPAAKRSEIRVPAASASGPRGGELVSMLSQAAELGLAGVEIDHYGLWPQAALAPIKQALRFAKRTRPV